MPVSNALSFFLAAGAVLLLVKKRTITIRIGTRSSELAMIQTHWVAARLRETFPYRIIIRKGIKASGDIHLKKHLKDLAAKCPGLFTSELEGGLLLDQYDAVVHSLKDMPTTLPDGLTLAGITEREDPRDAVLLHSKYIPECEAKGLTENVLSILPKGSVVGTSSVRREALLKRNFPHLEVQILRGNVNTRIRKLDEGQYDAIILAAAGLKRMGPKFSCRISEALNPVSFMYGVGQGSLGLQCRSTDDHIIRALNAIAHIDSAARCTAERALLHKMEGACQVPVGVATEVEGDVLKISCTVLSPDGSRQVMSSNEGPKGQAEELGIALAVELMSMGGKELMGKAHKGLARPITYGSAANPHRD